MRGIMKTAALAVLAAALATPASAQSAPSEGKRDLNGVWSNASSTRLERPGNFKQLVVPQTEAEALKKAALERNAAANAKSDLSEGAFKDNNSAAGYNAFWTDPGIGLMTVRGEARSSFITEPVDGRIPFRDRAKSLALPIREGIEYRSGEGEYPGPEDLPLRERCLIAQSDGGGPVMLSGLYNNNYEFHLTADHLVIVVEMVHDARIIPIHASAEAARAAHKPAVIQQWLGDTVGWWEGDTLVAETTKFHPSQFGAGRISVSENGKVTERFTRYSEDQILYEFEVNDPSLYTQVWKGEMSLNMLSGETGDVYEYACHEGNYGISGILAGGRKNDRDGVKNGAAGDRDDG